MGSIGIERRKMAFAVVLSFFLWGAGGLLLKRERLDILAVALHLYIYFVIWLFSGFWLLWFPVSALGGAYFTLDLGRRFGPK